MRQTGSRPDPILNMSQQELCSLGLTEVAYIRPVYTQTDKKGQQMAMGYMLCNADGTEIGLSASQEIAVLAAVTNNLFPMSVH